MHFYMKVFVFESDDRPTVETVDNCTECKIEIDSGKQVP